MYNDIQCDIVIYAFDLADEKFDIWNEVAPQLKFPCGPLKLNSWVNPKLDVHVGLNRNIDLFMFYSTAQK